MPAPDIVYVVRPGEYNEALRYSLRSLAHVPHGRVWIAGYRPSWVRGVEHIPVQQVGSKYQNSTANLRAAVERPDVSERFVFMHDDLFVMEPIPAVPILHRGTIREVERRHAARASGAYMRGMRETRELLERLGHDDPLCYELHVPMPMDKTGVRRALDLGAHLDVLHKRSMYGVVNAVGGDQITDVKVMSRSPRFPRDSPFLSTMPDAFTNGAVGNYIRRKLAQPGPYERRRNH